MGYFIMMGVIVVLVVAALFAIRYLVPAEMSGQRTTLNRIAYGLGGLLIALTFFKGATFYAEPGYNYHIRTVFGTEAAATTVGWKFHFFGHYEPFKKALSVVKSADEAAKADYVQGVYNIRMLDKVDGALSISVRFRLPDDTEKFLRMAREYRTESNLANTGLIPPIHRTMNVNAQLMTAEELYNGGRAAFDADFDYQMRHGIYLVKRRETEVKVPNAARAKAKANGSEGGESEEYGEDVKVIYEVEKLRDANGEYLVTEHNFAKFGVVVEDAVITDFDPNKNFVTRLESIQEASANRAKAREQRGQEEEQKLYIVAKGQREQAESQAAALNKQIQATTEAETIKALALIESNKQLEQAQIEKDAAAIQLDRDRIRAEGVKVLADAEAYKKAEVMKADNALTQKLEAEKAIQAVWAEAFAKRAVPSTVFVSGGGGGSTPTGSNTELSSMVQMMTMEMAKRLEYDRSVETK